MIEEFYKQECKLQKIEERNGPQTYQRARTALRDALKNNTVQFKIERIEKKIVSSETTLTTRTSPTHLRLDQVISAHHSSMVRSNLVC